MWFIDFFTLNFMFKGKSLKDFSNYFCFFSILNIYTVTYNQSSHMCQYVKSFDRNDLFCSGIEDKSVFGIVERSVAEN